MRVPVDFGVTAFDTIAQLSNSATILTLVAQELPDIERLSAMAS